jgi:uncharacterized membrane protein
MESVTMENDDDAVAKVIAVLVSIPATAIWRGYVLTVMWAWFVMPLGARPLGVAHAIGLAMLVGFLTHPAKSDPARKVMDAVVTAFLAPAIALALGWVVHSFM